MKITRKIMSIALTAVMMLAMSSLAVFAAADEYTITIDNAVKGETYSAYKIFDVTYSGDNIVTDPEAATNIPGSADNTHRHKAYSYTINTGSAWWNAVTNNHSKEEVNAGTAFTINQLTFTKTTTANIWNVTATNSFNAADFASLLNSAKAEMRPQPTADAFTEADDTTLSNLTYHPTSNPDYVTGTITLDVSNSGAGYYFVDTTTGALCSLDTTESNALIREKNSIPNINKMVSDTEVGTFGTSTTVSVGDKVYYKIEVTDGQGTETEITVHDTLSAGQTLDIGSFVVTDDTGKTPDSQNYYSITYDNDLTTTGTAAKNVRSDTALGATTITNGESFNIVFTADYIKSLGTNNKITITYSVILNDSAVIAGEGNSNTAKLTYSNQTSQDKQTKVYTYAGALYKFNADGDELANASFTMKTQSNTQMYFIQVDAGSNSTPAVYRYNSSYVSGQTVETKITTDTLTTPESGAIVIYGLETGSYTLTETAAPAGYNKMISTVTLTVNAVSAALTENITWTNAINGYESMNNDKVAKFEYGHDDTYKETTYQIHSNSVLGVLNLSGVELPSTGGMGTTIFYVIGTIFVIGAGVLLVTRRRMNYEK